MTDRARRRACPGCSTPMHEPTVRADDPSAHAQIDRELESSWLVRLLGWLPGVR